MSLDDFVARARADVERRLDHLLAAPPGVSPPGRILEAMRYMVLGAGKRFRPLLLIASGEACLPQAPDPAVSDRLLLAACAVEMIHSFSLIHDDLPALDDDALRRGRPTLHVRFDEATAILAGDALLNLAYETLSRGADVPATRLAALRAISRAVGLEGMIAGQVLDLAAEGVDPDGATLHRIHALKTGALISASCEAGGILAGAGEDVIARLREYGDAVGLAFQIVDDILDVEGSAAQLGKSPGKDAKSGKATFPAMWGIEASRRRAAASVETACAAVSGLRSDALTGLARGALSRKA